MPSKSALRQLLCSLKFFLMLIRQAHFHSIVFFRLSLLSQGRSCSHSRCLITYRWFLFKVNFCTLYRCSLNFPSLNIFLHVCLLSLLRDWALRRSFSLLLLWLDETTSLVAKLSDTVGLTRSVFTWLCRFNYHWTASSQIIWFNYLTVLLTCVVK